MKHWWGSATYFLSLAGTEVDEMEPVRRYRRSLRCGLWCLVEASQRRHRSRVHSAGSDSIVAACSATTGWNAHCLWELQQYVNFMQYIIKRMNYPSSVMSSLRWTVAFNKSLLELRLATRYCTVEKRSKVESHLWVRKIFKELIQCFLRKRIGDAQHGLSKSDIFKDIS